MSPCYLTTPRRLNLASSQRASGTMFMTTLIRGSPCTEKLMTTLAEAYSRRLLAFHTPSPVVERIEETIEELYNQNHSPRDGRFTSGSGGAGGKVWTGVSAHPDHRTPPKPGSLPTSDHGARALAKTLYETDLGNGYRAHVNTSETHLAEPGKVYVKGEILFNGRQRGSFERVIYQEAGVIVAHHELLIIDGHHRGLGLADRFNAHAVAEYQKLGVDRITLTAGDNTLSVGAYAWARQGFRHDGSDGARRAYLHRQLDRIEVQLLKPVLREHAPRVRKEVAALKKAIDAGQDVQPIHVASIGEKYARHTAQDDSKIEYTTWPGKSVLLGTKWPGVYYFDAAKPITAAATDLEHADLRPAFRKAVEDFACHDASCAPPPAGTGGSLQARRGVVPGYGPTRRRDITLGSVRVTYHPDYPDDHPDPGEVVWAKVRFQENAALSKDRPVLVIGRINGTDKLAAIQLTSQVNGRPNELPINVRNLDRLGRRSALKLDQIIVVDPKDYRREGSVLSKDEFEGVIGRLAAFHRTPVQIAAAAHIEEFYNHEHDPKNGRFTSREYHSGYAAGERGAYDALGRADSRGVHPDWYVGYHDATGGYPKGSGDSYKSEAPKEVGTFKHITKAEARGDSKPVSAQEFQMLATIGQKKLDVLAKSSLPIGGLDRRWGAVKENAWHEVQQSWGGATIDSHSAQPLPQGANKYALTVKGHNHETVSIHENATRAEFDAAMNTAKERFRPILERSQHYLGVFHDDENHRIDIDPVLVVNSLDDVHTIGAATHAIGGAYNFADGNGYWPPHVSEEA